MLDAPSAAHPGFRADAPHPIGERRDETEILENVLLADPTHGNTRSDDKVMVEPKMVSAMKMPSAWCRSARCRKSAVIALLASNQLWIAKKSSTFPPHFLTEDSE